MTCPGIVGSVFGLPGLLALVLLASSLELAADEKIDFAHDIVPILKSRCANCHTNGKYEGTYSLDTRVTAQRGKGVVPGRSADSKLIQRVTSTDKDQRMPAKADALPAKEIKLLKAWIDQGFAWDEGFTFKASSYVAPLKPRRPELPAAHAGREHPIDRIIDTYFDQHKIKAPASLDDTAFVRRIYLDLIGVLPAASEVDSFLAEAAMDKRAKLIRQLLDDKRSYTDHWLSFWNDLLRNDYAGTGFIDGGRKQISAWLYASLIDNKPYDQFVRELISPTPDSEGFIKGIKWRGSVNASQVQELQFSQNVSQVFFGINMKCASCHDSFINDWKLDDAYGLAAIIADAPMETFRCDTPTGRKASAKFLFPELGAIDESQPKAARLEQVARLVTHPDNGRFTRTIANRLWQRLIGRGIVHPVDIMENRPQIEDLIDYLGVALVDQNYDLKKLIELIVTSRAYQSHPVPEPAALSDDDDLYRGPELRRMTAEQFIDALWMVTRSSPDKAAAPVKLAEFGENVPAERRFIRTSLVNADALMRSLGRPNREQVVTTRPDQLTTLEALDLSNGQILTDLLARGAAKLVVDHPTASSDELAVEVYRRALCRRPTSAELDTARELIGSPVTADGIADLLWAVVMLPEFQLIR